MKIINIKPSKFTELCGWYGMVALISAYFLVSFSLIMANGIAFQILNFTGGIALIIFAVSKKATQLAILNFFWATIGLIAIIRLWVH